MNIRISDVNAQSIQACRGLWNRCCSAPDGPVYKTFSSEDFRSLFFQTDNTYNVFNAAAWSGDELVGFAAGSRKHDEEKGYITAVMVDRHCRRRGIGSRLLERIEERIAAEGKTECFDLIFFNPVALPWIVPGTDEDDHPNAPGVDVACDGYLFFKNRGYRDVVFQNTYYLPLSAYELPPDLEAKKNSLAEKGLKIELYNPAVHDGFEELFEDLGSDDWREKISSNIARSDGGDPVVILAEGRKVRGFAGPVRSEPGGRGYFAGIGIHSDCRGKGAGKALFAELCRSERTAGARFMTLFTGETNPARNIYEAAGFKIVKTWSDMRKIKKD